MWDRRTMTGQANALVAPDSLVANIKWSRSSPAPTDPLLGSRQLGTTI